MNYLKIILLLFFFSQSLIGYSQQDETLGLKRFFWGVIPSVVVTSDGKKEVKNLGSGYTLSSGGTEFMAAGVQFEIGNYWAFNKDNRTTGFFRLTWTRLGLHNYGLLIAPAQAGFGVHVGINEKSSFEAVLNGGLLIYTDDVLAPEFEFNYAIYPQIKFNIKHLSIALEYTYHRFEGRPINLLYGHHYFGIVFGGRFGKRIN